MLRHRLAARRAVVGHLPGSARQDEHEHEITAEVGCFTYRHGDHVVVRWKSALTPMSSAARSSRRRPTRRVDARFLRRPPQGPAARGRRPPRPDRRGVRARRRGRSRPPARPGEGAAGLRRAPRTAPTCSPATSAPPTSSRRRIGRPRVARPARKTRDRRRSDFAYDARNTTESLHARSTALDVGRAARPRAAVEARGFRGRDGALAACARRSTRSSTR